MPHPDETGLLHIGDKDTPGFRFHGSDLPTGVTISSAVVSVNPGAATDNTGDTDGTTGAITGMTDTSDFYVGDPVTVSAGFATTGPFTILSKTATSITVDALSNAVALNVTVARAAGLVLASGIGLIAVDGAATYAWVEAVRAGEYDVKFVITFSDSKVRVRTYQVIVIEN
ncbi:MAG: hypothetical protein IMZ54_11770 [Acidobacteria bacterium]|nr:hypothetical protein [Acidobacteriota bacterium]